MSITGRCHCGKVAFAIDAELPKKLVRCTCSFCSKRGALLAYFAPEKLQPTGPGGAGTTYRWNRKLVAHHFCEVCGCATWSDSPAFQRDGSWDGVMRRLGVNARLFDNFDAEAVPVEVIDGRHLW